MGSCPSNFLYKNSILKWQYSTMPFIMQCGGCGQKYLIKCIMSISVKYDSLQNMWPMHDGMKQCLVL